MKVKDIKEIIKNAKEKELDIKARDVAFVILRKEIEEDELIYSMLYGTDYDTNSIEEYTKSTKINYLTNLLKPKEKDMLKKINSNSISFDENKAGMEDDLRYIDKFIKDNETTLDPKEIAALMGKKADLRTKLNDKFGTSDKGDEQRIMVVTKFSGICDWTHRECPMTKEYAKEKFNLIDKTE